MPVSPICKDGYHEKCGKKFRELVKTGYDSITGEPSYRFGEKLKCYCWCHRQHGKYD